MKKLVGIRLKLISNNEKNQFIQSMIKGGISMISRSYGEAENKFSSTTPASLCCISYT